jgi:hypothetical protein
MLHGRATPVSATKRARAAPWLVAASLGLGTATGRAETPPARTATPAARPLVRRLCNTLHALPAKRKSECCGAAVGSLADLCTSEMSAALERGAVTLDAAAVDRCVAESARKLDGCDWVTPLAPPLPDACRGLVHGKLEVGVSCRSSLECRDGLYCRGATPGAAGLCAPPAPARARCEAPADNLASYARAGDDPRHRECDGLCIKGECLPWVPAGGPCPSSSRCAPGLQCVSGRCENRKPPGLGEPCAAQTTCAAGSCQAGQCRPLKNAGEACTLPSECRALACLKAPGAAVGRCGEPCGGSR